MFNFKNYKRKSKNLLIGLAVATGLIFSSCEKEKISPSEQIPEENQGVNSESMTVLGDQLENPYSVTNMKKAYSNLKSSSSETPDVNIETTHYYIRFLPKSEEELTTLKQDTLLDLYDYPLDYEILNPGVYYHDPNLPDSSITWQYCAVTIDKELPYVFFEKLADLYIPPLDEEDDDELKSASAITSFYENLEDEALRLTGNLDESTLKSTNAVQRKSKWRPAGRITVNGQAVIGCSVRARRWFTTHKGLTNTNGDFSCDGKFRRDANYSIKWERHYWSIRSGTWGQAYYNGPKQRGNWNLNITSGKSLRYAIIHSAAYDYFYRNPFNTQRPFEKKWYRSDLKIGYYDKLGDDKSADYAKWRNWLTWPHIRIYKGQSSTATTTQIYATTIHELAHCAHMQKIIIAKGSNRISDFYNADKKLKESWARGVQREFTTHFVSSTYRPSYHGNYTAIVHSLLPIGYTLRQLEDALVGASTMDEWKDNIESKYDNTNESQLDAIFARF